MPAAPLRAVIMSPMVAFTLLRHYVRLLRLSLRFPNFLYRAFKDWLGTNQRRTPTDATPQAYIPDPLPIKRPRAISYSEIELLRCAQEGSPLFTKLPAELRVMIYEYALAARGMIHLGIWNKTYWHRTCGYHPASLVLGTGYLHGCWAEPHVAGDEHLHRTEPQHLHKSEKTSDRLLALPLSCKRIYGETIDLLYSKNKFNVRRSGTISHMPLSLLPQRLQQIRTLELDIPIWRYTMTAPAHTGVQTDDSEYWPSACEVLARMKGLRSLTVCLSLLRIYSWSSPVVRCYVKPLMAIHVEEYNVCLLPGVLGKTEMAELGELPFRVMNRNLEH